MTPDPVDKRFEYRVLGVATAGGHGGRINDAELTALLNAHGADGWELVTVVPTAAHDGGTREITVMFKRQR